MPAITPDRHRTHIDTNPIRRSTYRLPFHSINDRKLPQPAQSHSTPNGPKYPPHSCLQSPPKSATQNNRLPVLRIKKARELMYKARELMYKAREPPFESFVMCVRYFGKVCELIRFTNRNNSG